jgi:hypothetical protein
MAEQVQAVLAAGYPFGGGNGAISTLVANSGRKCRTDVSKGSSSGASSALTQQAIVPANRTQARTKSSRRDELAMCLGPVSPYGSLPS